MIIDIATSRTPPADPTNTFRKLIILGLASTTLALLSQAWSKTSFAMTLLGITKKRDWVTYFLWFAIFSMNISFALAGILFWVQCSPLEGLWNPSVQRKCLNPSVNIIYGMVISGMLLLLVTDLEFFLLYSRIKCD